MNSAPNQRSTASLLSLVLPVFNEVAVLQELTDELRENCEPTGHPFEIVFVNDGSTDGSTDSLDALAAEDSRIRVLHLSRNFGHQPSVHAGLAHARGDAIILMDSDLQDDPAAIPKMLEQWQSGHDVVYAERFNRKENPLKRFMFYSFYRVLNRIASIPIPMDAGNFGLLDRAVVNQILAVGDYDRFLPGIRSWVGFRQIGVAVERRARHDDNPRVSLLQLFRLAKTAIFGFSRAPLTFFYWIAMLSIVVCSGCIGFTLYHKIITGLAIPGWTSITMVASLFGALNALGISVLGEYVIRIYEQVRGRPQFVVERIVNDATSDTDLESSLVDQIQQLHEEATRHMPQESASPRSTGTSAPASHPNLGTPTVS